MPIRAENRGRYPDNWRQIRRRILERAHQRCERCGVRNHSLGWRDRDGQFHYTGGNVWHDAAALGHLSFRDVADYATDLNRNQGGLGPHGERAIVIVLTIAHLNHQPEDCRDENLQALCQRCHNRLDGSTRRAGIRSRRHAHKRQLFPDDPIQIDTARVGR